MTNMEAAFVAAEEKKLEECNRKQEARKINTFNSPVVEHGDPIPFPVSKKVPVWKRPRVLFSAALVTVAAASVAAYLLFDTSAE